MPRNETPKVRRDRTKGDQRSWRPKTYRHAAGDAAVAVIARAVFAHAAHRQEGRLLDHVDALQHCDHKQPVKEGRCITMAGRSACELTLGDFLRWSHRQSVRNGVDTTSNGRLLVRLRYRCATLLCSVGSRFTLNRQPPLPQSSTQISDVAQARPRGTGKYPWAWSGHTSKPVRKGPFTRRQTACVLTMKAAGICRVVRVRRAGPARLKDSTGQDLPKATVCVFGDQTVDGRALRLSSSNFLRQYRDMTSGMTDCLCAYIERARPRLRAQQDLSALARADPKQHRDQTATR